MEHSDYLGLREKLEAQNGQPRPIIFRHTVPITPLDVMRDVDEWHAKRYNTIIEWEQSLHAMGWRPYDDVCNIEVQFDPVSNDPLRLSVWGKVVRADVPLGHPATNPAAAN